MVQEGPETPKDRSKTPTIVPRRLKWPPKRAKRPPRGVPRGPREAKFIDFSMVFEGFLDSRHFGDWTLQDGPRRFQDRPKTA